MVKVQDIEVINIDNVPYAVGTMSESAKKLIAIYNDWNQQEADIHNKLMLVKAAKETLSRQIVELVRKEQAEAATASTAEAEDSVVENLVAADADAIPAEEVVEPDPVVAPVVAPIVPPSE